MASTVEKTESAEVPPPPPPPPASWCSSSMLDPLLRLLLLASSIVAVVVIVTGNETQLIYNPLVGGGKVPIPAPAKWRYSPAFVYFVAALSVAGLYSIISGLASLSNLYKLCSVPTKTLLILITFDVLLLGIVASAVGTAGGVAYIGLKGNKHVNWGKICNTYGKFCRHKGSSIAVALFASVVLLLLIFGNACALYRRAESKP